MDPLKRAASVTKAVAPVGEETPAAVADLCVDLDVFDGPFDLLITLILKEEIDIWEVRVSRIVADYIVRLADNDGFDLEATSHFVLLVAALLEIKSHKLLGVGRLLDEDEEFEAEEAGEELLTALLRYTQFRRASEHLEGLYDENARRIYRSLPIPHRFSRRASVEPVMPTVTLARTLEILLREPPAPDASHITDLAITLVAELKRLRDLLCGKGTLTFAAVAPRNRLEKAMTFFALLELHNRGEVRLAQKRGFGEITITRLAAPAGEADDALAAVG